MARAARGTGIVGSVSLELERGYRIMLLKVAKELTVADCQDIAFVTKLPAPTCVPEPGKPAINLHTMNTMESLGLVGPLRVDFLEDMLKTIGKNYLLEIIDDYKKTSVYKEAKKRLDEQEKKRRNIRKKVARNPQDPSLSGCSPEAQELLAFKADATKKCRLKESYATLLTQFSQMTLLLRSAIENDDLTQMEDIFVSVARDSQRDTITRTLLKNLSAAGIKCGSARDSSSIIYNSAATLPTDSEAQPLGTMAAAHSPTNSPRRAVRMETQHQFHHVGPINQEGPPSPSAQRKRPIPLPRKKWPAQPESSGMGGVPVSSPSLSLRVTTKFVYCQQESQLAPASGLSTALLHIPQSASTSCLTCSSDYSGDYSGDYTGTGDSGVGDVRSKYTPSQEALDQLEPRQRQQPSAEHGQAEAEGDGNQQSRYMKLVPLEEKSSADGYTKARRARSLEFEGNPVDSNPNAVHSRITDDELKKAASKLKGSLLHSNPHAIRRCITGGELKKAAEKLKQQKAGSSSQVVSQSPNGNGIPRARQPTHPPSKTQDAQNDNARDSAIDIAEEEDPYTLVIDSDEDGDEDPYTLPDPVEATAQQNATPTYENLPLNPGANLPTTVGYRTERATSFSTYSNTGDSGFSDSRAYFKGQPPSSTQHAPYQREQGSSIDSGASPITTDVQSGYYKSLNPESRVPEAIYDDASCQSSNEEAQEYLAFKADATKKLKESYATLLTQFSQMTLRLRSAIENDDLTQMEDTFVSIASDGDAIIRTLHKNLSAAGIKCGSDSSSSSINSAVTSPTDSEVQSLGTMAAAHSSAHSPHQSRAIRMVTQHHFHHTGPISQEGSPSPSAQRKSRTARRARSLEFEDIDKIICHTFKSPPSVSTYYQCSKNLASVPFLDTVEILTCTSSGCEYYNHDHDIVLKIPAGAIPPGQTAHLEVAVALYGPFQFPDGSCPISPILWLCIQENIGLRKPIDVVLPHFLSDSENLGIRFSKADHRQYTVDEAGRKLYVFMPLETAVIAYEERNQNYGILSTQHCCFFCITSNDPQISPDFALKAGYYLWCIEKPFSYSSPTKSRDTLLFCATFCLPTCRKALKSQYTEKEGYFIGKPNFFRFKDPGDGLEPSLSIEVEDEGCILAANPKNKQVSSMLNVAVSLSICHHCCLLKLPYLEMKTSWQFPNAVEISAMVKLQIMPLISDTY